MTNPGMKKVRSFRVLLERYGYPKKVLGVLSTNLPWEKMEKEPSPSPVKPSENGGNSSFDCPHYFGYLASGSNDALITKECLICLKLADCMLKSDGKR